MAGKGKQYELFGSYLLFKKLESDRLSESWRAGEIHDGAITGTVVVRRFHGGDRDALRAGAEHARAIVAGVSGTTIVKGQKIGFAGGVPYLAHEFAGGRSLRTIVDKARGSSGVAPNPLPVDQALAIVEKLALSIDTLSAMRYQGARLNHGALIPQFVWISEEGEVRAAGQQFGRGIVASLEQAEVARELAGYFAPEARAGGEASKASDVYSLGGILYLLLTGQETPADAAAAIPAAKLAAGGAALPADIRPILERSLSPDPAKRFGNAAEMREALDKLLNGGEYSPTTFNLAFYLHNLLRKEIELEEQERQQEAAVDPKPYLEPLPQAVVAPAPAPQRISQPAPVSSPAAPAPFAAHAAEKKNRMPLIAAAVGVLVVGGGAAAMYVMKAGAPAATAPATTAAAAISVPLAKASAPPQPISVVAQAAPAAATAQPLDPEAKKKALEEAINKRLAAEMMKLQDQYNRELQQKKAMEPSRTAAVTMPVQRAAAPPVAREENPPSAAQLDQQRRQQSLPVAESPAQQPPAPLQAPPLQQSAPAPVQTAAAVQEGDVVSFNDLDKAPTPRSAIRPSYPPIAMKRRTEGNVLVSALVSETGKVIDVKILRADSTRSGFDEAALRAVRQASFTPPMKSGKRVKTWAPMPIIFKLQ